jgi:DNA-binding GntR family transcriptional regulator
VEGSLLSRGVRDGGKLKATHTAAKNAVVTRRYASGQRTRSPREVGPVHLVPPVSRTSLVEVAYHAIRRRILDNVYAPGLQVLEQTLATELGISRTPLRQALTRLQEEGLVEVIPRHGMRVLPVSPADMHEIYVVLTALESAAAELLARRRPSEAELKPLVDASRDMARALKADDLDAWAHADASFHQRLVQLTANRTLIDAVARLGDRVHRARTFSLRLRPKPVNSTQEHMALIERIRAGDVPGAVDVNRKHRERASGELLAIFERYRLHQM